MTETTPQTSRQPAELKGKDHDQDRPDDERRNAEAEQRNEAADVIPPLPTLHRGVEAERQSDALGEAKRQQAERQRDRQRAGDDVIDRVIAVLR